MKKGTVIIKVDWVPNNYSAAPLNDAIACVATGDTLEQVRANIVDALHFHIEGMMEDGEEVPMEFSGEWTPEFVLTTRAQLKYTDNYISRKALARETGIAEQQLSHYANGQRHPRPAMQARITAGIRTIAERLFLVL